MIGSRPKPVVKYPTLPIDETVALVQLCWIDVKNAAEWSSLYTGLPLAIVGALNLKSKFKLSPDAK